MTTTIFFLGAALVVTGVAMLTIPGAFIAAGVAAATFAIAIERDARAGDQS